jgi:hypothetical protein
MSYISMEGTLRASPALVYLCFVGSSNSLSWTAAVSTCLQLDHWTDRKHTAVWSTEQWPCVLTDKLTCNLAHRHTSIHCAPLAIDSKAVRNVNTYLYRQGLRLELHVAWLIMTCKGTYCQSVTATSLKYYTLNILSRPIYIKIIQKAY